MQIADDELNQTRTTLINRLQNWQDQASWQEFFDTYWKLIYGFAIKSGLTGTEAQDVVQETMISVAKHMPHFKYDRRIGSFKAWLMNLTRWRITDQFRKRGPACHSSSDSADHTDPTHAESLENLPDLGIPDMESLWDAEWKATLLEAALGKVKRKLDPQHFQVFDLYVNKEWEPDRIAKIFGIAVDQVYVRKNRVSNAIKAEVERLQNAMA